MKHKKHHMWTKDEVKSLYTLWEDTSIEDLADKLKVEVSQIRTMAGAMRKKGFKLAHKRKNGYIQSLLDEVKKELKLK